MCFVAACIINTNTMCMITCSVCCIRSIILRTPPTIMRTVTIIRITFCTGKSMCMRAGIIRCCTMVMCCEFSDRLILLSSAPYISCNIWRQIIVSCTTSRIRYSNCMHMVACFLGISCSAICFSLCRHHVVRGIGIITCLYSVRMFTACTYYCIMTMRSKFSDRG